MSSGNASWLTVIKTTNPATVQKRYTMGPDGSLVKTAIANVIEGVAEYHHAVDADAMAHLLRDITRQSNRVLCAGRWRGCDGESFRIVTERELARKVGKSVGDEALGGVVEHNGERFAARLKRGIAPSQWVLFDADNPPGIPPHLAAMTVSERLEYWETMLPGLSTNERVELRGSSSRVHSVDEEPGPATHVWMRVDDPSSIARMKAYLSVAMVNQGLSFRYKRHSRLVPGTVVGIEARSVFDLSVFDAGRLVFCAQPDVEPAGYVAADADIKIVNRGGGLLHIAHLKLPSRKDLKTYRERTGIDLELMDEGLSVIDRGQLSLDTEITRRGEAKRLVDWLEGMRSGDKLRCESPFRESSSEAAFILKKQDGSAIVHDVGSGTTYTMQALDSSPERSHALPLTVFAPSSLDGKEVPERQWVVKNWVPVGVVTGLYGDGGTGKTLAVQQLQTCTALDKDWFGQETQAMRSLGVYCEDSSEELHRRQDDINRLYGCTYRDLENMYWLVRLGEDNILMRFEKGQAYLTEFARQIIVTAKALCATLVIIDTVADTFGGNENDRGQVRQYVQAALGFIAREIGGTVVVCAHPSRSGLASGEGDGGSTGWSNSFRSRLSLERPKGEDKDTPPDPDERLLVRRKANYASRDDVINLRWQTGAFASHHDDVAPERPSAESVFLDLLERATKEGRRLSDNNRSGNFAPKEFAHHPARQGYRRGDFDRAMRLLFDQGAIRIVGYGRPDKGYRCIERIAADGGLPADLWDRG